MDLSYDAGLSALGKIVQRAAFTQTLRKLCSICSTGNIPAQLFVVLVCCLYLMKTGS